MALPSSVSTATSAASCTLSQIDPCSNYSSEQQSHNRARQKQETAGREKAVYYVIRELEAVG
jgi:hypothetical protein